ncbi:hypothetical protein BDN72DRAFT_882766 [Pluteus cervinus]|uniref:Uncharacterized protein n=1 Tax=Pluteus cervinus TaxID=181527 RepID=A0ACD3A9I8_9AGAR|nr:hypothetical protein BDN72DRAFT_882766 [Pluteus cervinus]
MSCSITLPLDLERSIFELALQDNAINPVNLLLVTPRVHDWLLPFFKDYKTVRVRSLGTTAIDPMTTIVDMGYSPLSPVFPSFPRRINAIARIITKTIINHSSDISPLNTSCIEAYGRLTRRLLIEYHDEYESTLNHLITHCPNIKSLALWGPDVYPGVITLTTLNHLTHLSIDLESLDFLKDMSLESNMDFTTTNPEDTSTINLVTLEETIQKTFKAFQDAAPAFFSRVTHLEIQNDEFDVGIVEADEFKVLKNFTSITHLRIPAKCTQEIANYVVETCPQLRVLLVLLPIALDDKPEEISADLFENFKRDNPVIGLETTEDIDGEWMRMGVNQTTRDKMVVVCYWDSLDAWKNEEKMWAEADRIMEQRLKESYMSSVAQNTVLPEPTVSPDPALSPPKPSSPHMLVWANYVVDDSYRGHIIKKSKHTARLIPGQPKSRL